MLYEKDQREQPDEADRSGDEQRNPVDRALGAGIDDPFPRVDSCVDARDVRSETIDERFSAPFQASRIGPACNEQRGGNGTDPRRVCGDRIGKRSPHLA